ncbi:hypothetical protein SCUCBS95973_007663 [Sporothrix curviconia]|uniref:Uncharacterized protein n=1 Tax=Sporothrix curviconia TaxID=1260050 RepID=A0ABP0CF44_9PEZI
MVTALQQDNERLRSQVTGLAGLVEEMATRLTVLEKTSTQLVTTAGQNAARLMTHSSTIGSLEAKVASQGAILSKVESVDLESLNNFMANEKPQQQETLNKQEIAVAKLKTQMIAVESGLQATTATQNQLKTQQQQQQQQQANNSISSASASASSPAPVITPPNVPAPAPASLVFPGDDFPSLRIEISELNEKTDKIETRQKGTISAIAKNTIDVKKLQDELQKHRVSWSTMSKTFGDLLDKETKDRLADSERLKELGNTVQQLQQQPLAAQTSASAASNEVEMAKTGLGPFLSPVPEAANPTDAVGSAEPPAPLKAVNAQGVPEGQQPNGGPSPQDLENVLQVLQALQERMKSAEDGLQATRLDFDGQCATLRMMVSTLDSQFNNLTTKDLYHAIIGHMERLYPTPRQLREDIKSMIAEIHSMKQHGLAVDKALQRLGDFVDAIGAARISKRTSADAAGNDSSAEESLSAKRQKTKSARASPNSGGPVMSDSGHGRANGSATAARAGP